MAWTTPKKQDAGAIISRALWQEIVDNINWLYDNLLLSLWDRIHV